MEPPEIFTTEKQAVFRKKREAHIQKAIIEMLTLKGWYVLPTHGSMYQSGFPDLFATHQKFGYRWIEVKYKNKYSFTPAQIRTFPLLCANGSGVWILISAANEEYLKLFRPFNWFVYLL